MVKKVMTKVARAITEDTPVSIGIVVVIIGAATWMTASFTRWDAIADTVKNIQAEHKDERKEYYDHLLKIETDITEMKGDIKAMRKGE